MLGTVDRGARVLNHSLQELGQRLHALKTSNFLGEPHQGSPCWDAGAAGRGFTLPPPPSGAFDSIRQSHRESQEAEQRADASTRAVPNPVSTSAATRRRTEQLLASRRDNFNRQNAANRRALTDLAARARELSLHPLNEKVGRGDVGTWGWEQGTAPGDGSNLPACLFLQVCGATSDVPCSESPCGGAGCRDEDGTRRCGGLSCGGAVSKADSALDRARHAQEELRHAAGEVAQLSHRVRVTRAWVEAGGVATCASAEGLCPCPGG